MKKFKNYISENNINKESVKDKIVFLYKNIKDNVEREKQLRELIDINVFDYVVELEKDDFYKYRAIENVDYDLILKISGSVDDISEYLDEDGNYVFDYINYQSSYPPEEYVDDDEIQYRIKSENIEICKDILNELSIKYNDNNLIEYTIKVIKILNIKTISNMTNNIGYYIGETKTKYSDNISKKINFELDYNSKKSNFDIIIRLNDDDIYSDYQTIDKWLNNEKKAFDLSFFQNYTIDNMFEKDLDSDIEKDLKVFYENIIDNENNMLNNIKLFDNIEFIVKIGGVLLENIKDYKNQIEYFEKKHKYYSDSEKYDLVKDNGIISDEAERFYKKRKSINDFNL